MNTSPDPGSVIDGVYQVLRAVGGGSFSDVYLVEGEAGPAALKLLRRAGSTGYSEAAITDFKNEFSILKELHHPHIAGIIDFGYASELKQFYFTSEFIDGPDLYKFTEEKSAEQILELIVQVLRAFNYLHAYGIYHLDVKAANLLVTDQSPHQVKVIDFGLASMNPEGRLAGTPSYMAPEIVKGERPDGRADIYSLGVLFYYCLVRTNPFRGKGVQATLEKQLSVIPAPPSEAMEGLSSFLDPVLLKMLQKNPGDRYQRVDEILKDIHLHSPHKIPLETRETLLSYLPEEGRLIGRKKEWRQFQRLFSKLFQEKSTPAAVSFVTGEYGVGKSRFLKEIRYHVELNEVSLLAARCEPGKAFQECLEAFRQELEEDRRPTAILLDDLDSLNGWKEGEGALLGALARFRFGKKRKNPLLFIGAFFSRKKLSAKLAELLPKSTQKDVSLKSFTQEELSEYLVSLTGIEDPPKDLLGELWNRTEGNPLLVTEILRSLIQEGVLFDSGGRWRKTVFEDVGVDFSKVKTSDLLKDIFIGRAERLSASEKMLLELMAVSDRPLHVNQMMCALGLSEVSSDLKGLRQHDLVTCEGLEEGYRVKNDALSGVLYAELSESKRGKLHDSLALLYPEDSEERAFHELRGSELGHALQVARQWGERYLQQAHARKAIAVFQSILSRLPAHHDKERIDFLLKLSEAHLINLEYSLAKETCEEASYLLAEGTETPSNRPEKIDALIRTGAVSLKLGETEEAKAFFTQAQELARDSSESSMKEMTLKNFQASILFQEGHLDQAEESFRQTLRLWKESLSENERGQVTNNDLGIVLLARGAYQGAKQRFEEDLSFYRQLGDQLLLARGHYNLAEAHLGLQEFTQAIEHYAQAAHFSLAIKNTELLLRSYNGLGNAYNLTEDYARSVDYYERGLALCERMGDLASYAAIRVNIGIIHSQRGDPQAALDQLLPAVTFLKNIPSKTPFDWQTLCRALLETGEIARRQKEWKTSEQHLQEALDCSNQHEGILKFWILLALTELCRDQGNKKGVQFWCRKMAAAAKTKEEKDQLQEIEGKLVVPKTQKSHYGEKRMKNPYAYILQINKYINAESDFSFVLKSVLNYALELCHAESGLILLLNDAGSLEVRASVNVKESDSLCAFSRTIAERAIESGESIQTSDAQSDERFSEEASIVGLNLKSVLCLPIRSKEKTIGALYLENSCQAGAFEGLDLEVLNAFTDQVGIAIENTRTLEDSERSQRFLEKRVEEVSHERDRYQSLVSRIPKGMETKYEKGGIIGQSKAMQEVFTLLDKITDTDLSVYVHGESGTGKELIARALHDHSMRKEATFIALNCGAIPLNLMESELFGYKAGAFTGANRDKKGLIEEAHGGTLFLDEISELDPQLQVKLLRLLQEGEFRRVGDTSVRQADIRLVAASNQDIETLIGSGKFREDLYYRLCQIRIDLPPLKERTEDIPLLVDYFLGQDKKKKKPKIVRRLMKAFLEYSWPGNIRELESLLNVATALADKGVIDESAVPSNHAFSRFVRGGTAEGKTRATRDADESDKTRAETAGPSISIDEHNEYDPAKSWYDYERLIIAKALASNDFRVKETAALLGLATTTLYKKMREWKLKDLSHPLVQEKFVYQQNKKLGDYISKIFEAALKNAEDKPYAAIAKLKVSPGYFYKVIGKNKRA